MSGSGGQGDVPAVAVLTDVPFWQPGRGDAARILSMLRYLAPRVELCVVLVPPAGTRYPEPPDLAERIGGGEAGPAPPAVHRLPDEGVARQVRALSRLLAAVRPQVCIVEYLRLSRLLTGVPPGIATFLDTHDLVSERRKSFERHGETAPSPLGREEELAVLRRFDKVIAIQARDHEFIRRELGEDRALLAPHAVVLPRQPLRDPVRVVGFVASVYRPNVDAMQWFLGAVWPSLADLGLELHVFGAVAQSLPVPLPAGVVPRGVVRNLAAVYADIHVAINPVRFGAGLKIKTVEALASGLPLVTTPEGARGLEEHAGRAFALAADAAGFAERLAAVAGDARLRASLADGGYALAQARFSPQACYGALLACCAGQAGVAGA